MKPFVSQCGAILISNRSRAQGEKTPTNPSHPYSSTSVAPVGIVVLCETVRISRAIRWGDNDPNPTTSHAKDKDSGQSDILSSKCCCLTVNASPAMPGSGPQLEQLVSQPAKIPDLYY